MDIHIRLSLHTAFGPVGPRLERGIPMPLPPYDFPDTVEGREAAKLKAEQLNEYIKTHKNDRRN